MNQKSWGLGGKKKKKAKLSLDFKFLHNPLLLHEEGKGKTRNFGWGCNDNSVWSVVCMSVYVCVCIFICNDKQSPNTASALNQAEIPCQARCTPPKADTNQIYNKAHTYTGFIYTVLLPCTHPHFTVNHQLFYPNDLTIFPLPPTFIPLTLFLHFLFTPPIALAQTMSRQVLCIAIATCR